MRRNPTAGRRAEGYAEYVLILSLMMICTISTFFTAGSEGLRSVARSRQLCTMEKGSTRECDNLVRRSTDPANPEGTPDANDPEAGANPDDPANPADPAAQPDPTVSAPPPPPVEVPWYSRVLFGPEGPNSTMDDMLLAFFGFFGSLF